MKIRPLDIGVESVTRWQAEDEVHLPVERALAPAFQPLHRPLLDAILRRPSLDERLPALMQPATLDPDLLRPTTLAAARRSARAQFLEAASRLVGRQRDLLRAAAACLDQDIALEEEVAAALAALLRA